MRPRRWPVLLCVGAFACCASGSAPAPCRFAKSYTCEGLINNPAALAEFSNAVFQREGEGFHVPGVGYEPRTAFTYDGHPISPENGTLVGEVHGFSAPSKESLHVGLLALAIDGNAGALAFIGGRSRALELLASKMATYEAFNVSMPGFGCHIPWVTVTAAGIVPTPDWSNPFRVPALDNGELVWAVFAAARALSTTGESALAARYAAWFSCMAGSAKAIFYKTAGHVTTVTEVRTISQQSRWFTAGVVIFISPSSACCRRRAHRPGAHASATGSARCQTVAL